MPPDPPPPHKDKTTRLEKVQCILWACKMWEWILFPFEKIRKNPGGHAPQSPPPHKNNTTGLGKLQCIPLACKMWEWILFPFDKKKKKKCRGHALSPPCPPPPHGDDTTGQEQIQCITWCENEHHFQFDKMKKIQGGGHAPWPACPPPHENKTTRQEKVQCIPWVCVMCERTPFCIRKKKSRGACPVTPQTTPTPAWKMIPPEWQRYNVPHERV